MLNHSQVESLSKKYYKVRWNYYKLRQLSLLQSAMDRYYKLRQLFYYKVRQGLLQITTGITKCDDCYKLRQCKGHLNQWCTLFYIFAQERCSSTLFAFDKRFWQTGVNVFGFFRSRRFDILLVKNWLDSSAVTQSSFRCWKSRCWSAEMGRLICGSCWHRRWEIRRLISERISACLGDGNSWRVWWRRRMARWCDKSLSRRSHRARSLLHGRRSERLLYPLLVRLFQVWGLTAFHVERF